MPPPKGTAAYDEWMAKREAAKEVVRQRNNDILSNLADNLYTAEYSGLDVSVMEPQERIEALELIEDVIDRRKFNAVHTWFPDEGEFSRDKYEKHTAFFRAGKTKTERLFLAGNRCGKSVTAAVEMSFHVTGRYPDWWEGHRFSGKVKCYASGKTAKNTRDICQYKLLGEYTELGTGTIPKDCIIGEPVAKPGVPQAYELVTVKHHDADGNVDGNSVIYFKSYDQGMESFMGTEVDLAWEDEEPPLDVHSEVLTRLMTTDGLLMLTFTPLEGMTEVVLSYLEDDLSPVLTKAHVEVVTCGWDDVPHLSPVQKERLLSSTPPHLKEARSKGIPSIGSGAVYPVKLEDITCDPFDLPKHFPRGYGMDVGWHVTAALWGALDRDNDILYIYGEYYRGEEIPAVHASAIQARGKWIKGTCDFAGANLDDGTKMFDKYVAEGLKLIKAEKAVEAGIFEVYQRMATGRLKIFSSCLDFFKELRLYQRDKLGKIIKKNDHLMDAIRYLCMSVQEVVSTPPTGAAEFDRSKIGHRRSGEYGRDSSGGSRWAM